jgi:chaperonin cofactor prefoldin
MVLDQLVDPTRMTPSPPSSAVGGSVSTDISTPKALARVQRLEERLEDRISRLDRSPSRTRQLVKKLAKVATEWSGITLANLPN